MTVGPETSLTFTAGEIADVLEESVGLAEAVKGVDALTRYHRNREKKREETWRLGMAAEFLESVYLSCSEQGYPFGASKQAEVFLSAVQGKTLVDDFDGLLRTYAAYAVTYGAAHGEGQDGLVDWFEEVGVQEADVVELVRHALVRQRGGVELQHAVATVEEIFDYYLFDKASVSDVFHSADLDNLREEFEQRGFTVQTTFKDEEED